MNLATEQLRQETEQKQKAYDEASITSSRRTLHAYGRIPQRTSSLDRDSFRYWSKRFEKKHYAPSSAKDRAKERQEALKTHVHGLMLERVGEGEQEVKEGRVVYRRFGIATLEIREGRTAQFEDVVETSIVIV
ncbi:uncharacterized protein LTR77_009561 [Saxophila tyrrhenica]|uniref:Uncharacterized protein n=1 Tax=Saxophila tyrrhenica TaxID=1690608 RepID=A0AAV9NYK2_9PEZI|nr:hypothetical protein LTR77_009561 [Saxophila tyrrhenica]